MFQTGKRFPLISRGKVLSLHEFFNKLVDVGPFRAVVPERYIRNPVVQEGKSDLADAGELLF